MNARILVVAGLGLVCSALVLGATIERQDSGGLWSTVNSWDPNQLPDPNDVALHGTMASGTMTYDSGVTGPNQTIMDFRFIEGSSRGLFIDEDLTLTVTNDFARMSGSGGYTTELDDGSTLMVGGAITRGNWIVGNEAVVNTASVALAGNSDWTLNAGSVNVSGSITRITAVNTFTINDGGTLDVDGSADFFNLTVNSGGTADINDVLEAGGDAIINGGTLTAGSHDTTSSEEFFIRNGGSVTITGAMDIGSNASLQYGDQGAGPVDNTLSVGSLDLAFISSQILPDDTASAPSLALTVAGDLNVETNDDAMVAWDSTGVALTFDAGGTVSFEAISTDYRDVNDVNDVGVWMEPGCATGITNPDVCTRPWASLSIASGTTVNVVDSNVNTYRGDYGSDAIYVDGDINVPSGATLNLGSIVLYYTGSRLGTGTINGTYSQVSKVCYGDFDADGDVDLGDFADFSLAFSGATNPSDLPVADSDCDTDVDLGDFANFSLNFTGANNACPPNPCPGGFPESGSAPVEDLAEWCLANLSTAQREEFAELLYAAAEEMGETEEAAEMLDLADLITE